MGPHPDKTLNPPPAWSGTACPHPELTKDSKGKTICKSCHKQIYL